MADDQRWELLSVDEREPTEDEEEAFREKKPNQYRDDSDQGDSGTESMVADGSLELLEESDSYWQFRFRPRADSDDEERISYSDFERVID